MYTHEILQVITAFCGTLGFALLFNIRGKKLIFAALGGMLAWLLFLVLGLTPASESVRYFAVAAALSIYSEVLARVLKTPTTTFCIVTLIPLVPGSALYYSMASALDHNLSAFAARAFYTLELTVALSLGIVLVTAGTKYITALLRRRRAAR